MSDRIKFEMEFPIKVSQKLLFQYISTPSGLSEWFADNVNSRGEIFIFIWDDSEESAKLLRKSNINTEFYPDSVSLKKQLNYANKNMIPYVLFYGDEEKKKLYFNLKDMNSGNQQKLSKDQLLKVLVEN